MNPPLDLGGWEILLATTILILGTVVLSVLGALGARAVDRIWDLLGGS